ncbi:tetratricopeptide repeat-containing sulfotransferase family protein [Roseicyclus amphidinii]|uniref:tetratricopeptide repeat-containing sulfotransferase family protein n=1 Tax=Roseicyclus amphidinii TaxID=3034232 RepID=UPI0024E06698|nr:sulfotransferase [Roseicyclus sp. Amp-Y-6]
MNSQIGENRIKEIAAEVNILFQLNKTKALRKIEAYVAQHPRCAPLQMILAEVQADLGDFDSAQKSYAITFSLAPAYPAGFISLAKTLIKAEKYIAAEKALHHAKKLQPSSPVIYRTLGELSMLKNDPKAARKYFETCLSLNPSDAEIHRRIGNLKRYTHDDPQISRIEALIDSGLHKDSSLANLHYAHAKAMEDIGRLKEAFESYEKGGACQRAFLGYDRILSEQELTSVKSALEKVQNTSFDVEESELTNTPIFIIGMPRSGTTLLEQIISQHTQVTPGGELNLLSRLAFTNIVHQQDLRPEHLTKVRSQYYEYCEKTNLETPYFTDKLPHNFRFASLIPRCFPEAKIIHVTRDPRATCWSNFKQFFSGKGMHYSWSIEDTVAYYNMYLDLMDFHREHMNGEMIEIRYEELVANPHVEIPKLIAALGLDWQDACLEPQNNKRAVRTASQMQVQQSIYKGSSDGWRKFEPFLAEAFSKLNEV